MNTDIWRGTLSTGITAPLLLSYKLFIETSRIYILCSL